MYWFTADEHYGHKNIIKYCDRPFKTDEEMDQTLIDNHNSVVGENDVVFHIGDFTLRSRNFAQSIIRQLNGSHVFLEGSHDRWLKQSHAEQIRTLTTDSYMIVMCHYCLRTWHCSHYGAYHVYGHSHGKLPPIGKSWDIGVDNNHYLPVSLEQLVNIMDNRPDNPNLISKRY